MIAISELSWQYTAQRSVQLQTIIIYDNNIISIHYRLNKRYVTWCYMGIKNQAWNLAKQEKAGAVFESLNPKYPRGKKY